MKLTKIIDKIQLIKFLINIFSSLIIKINYDVANNLLFLYSKSKNFELIFNVLSKLSNIQLKSLIDITAVDLLTWKNESKSANQFRFLLNYVCLSYKYNFYIIIKKIIPSELQPIKSLTKIYKSANWLEREVWDLFGIVFFNHPDLRRILTDYGFNGYPLRKDFPLLGFIELRYDDEYKRIVYEPLEMSQEFRLFKFLSPWDHNTNYKNINIKYE